MGIAIRLKEVSFKYDGAKENVLENINLTVEYGETVLLSGVSGEEKHPAFDNKRCYSVR